MTLRLSGRGNRSTARARERAKKRKLSYAIGRQGSETVLYNETIEGERGPGGVGDVKEGRERKKRAKPPSLPPQFS